MRAGPNCKEGKKDDDRKNEKADISHWGTLMYRSLIDCIENECRKCYE